MSFVCHSCANDIQGDRIDCRGFCKAVFHPKCCDNNKELWDTVNRNPQIFWMCNSCSIVMNDIRQRKNIKDAYDAGIEKQLSTHTELLEQLKKEIMVELKDEIRSNFTKIVNSSSITPVTTRPTRTLIRTIESRRLFQRKDENVPTLIHATGDSLSPSYGRLTVPIRSDTKFWLYLSRIASDVTPEQISDLVKNRLATQDVEVVRLVARNRDVQSMSFISYKVGVSTDLKTKALSPPTWPKGLLFREFVDNRKNQFFWKPEGVTNVMNVSATSTLDKSIGESPMLQ